MNVGRSGWNFFHFFPGIPQGYQSPGSKGNGRLSLRSLVSGKGRRSFAGNEGVRRGSPSVVPEWHRAGTGPYLLYRPQEHQRMYTPLPGLPRQMGSQFQIRYRSAIFRFTSCRAVSGSSPITPATIVLIIVVILSSFIAESVLRPVTRKSGIGLHEYDRCRILCGWQLR